MKRRFRITITPDNSWVNFCALKDWVSQKWYMDFDDNRVHYRGWLPSNRMYVVGIEVFDKTAKAL